MCPPQPFRTRALAHPRTVFGPLGSGVRGHPFRRGDSFGPRRLRGPNSGPRLQGRPLPPQRSQRHTPDAVGPCHPIGGARTLLDGQPAWTGLGSRRRIVPRKRQGWASRTASVPHARGRGRPRRRSPEIGQASRAWPIESLRPTRMRATERRAPKPAPTMTHPRTRAPAHPRLTARTTHRTAPSPARRRTARRSSLRAASPRRDPCRCPRDASSRRG
jgi:hypothetical protein